MRGGVYRILVADDHFVVCAGLRALIDRESELVVVGEAANGVQAVRMARELKQDLVVMDLRMPELSGLEATRRVLSENPEIRVLILSTFDGDVEIRRALEAGAAGYVVKRKSGEQMVPAIRAVLECGKWIPDELKKQLAETNRFEPLTDRELSVLRLMARGDANKEIAAELGITENTAKTHLRNIIAKFGVRDRTEAVMLGLKRGVIQLTE